jgi:Rrf2 family protein
MNFTAKEDYGLRAVLDLAQRGVSGSPVQAREIAQRQRIPEQFLEQLLASLRRAEVVRSTRGAGGGYALASDPSRLTVGDVLRALSGPLVPGELVEGAADDLALKELPEAAVVRSVWGDIREALRQVCDTLTIADLLDRRAASEKDSHIMMNI